VEEYLERRAASIEAAVEERREKRGDTRAARKELTRLERRIDTLHKKEAVLHDQLAAAATDYAKVAELDAQLRDVVAEREAAEETWLELADEV
jgi:ATP-binding cassette subfamily F protein uup